MYYFILKFISFIHLLIVLFILIVPFLNMNYLLLLHAIIVPFIVMHWLLNNNTCALTLAERNLKKILYEDIDDDDCFTCKLIEPVYDFKKNFESYSILIYVITIGLWLMSAGKLYYKYKTRQITNYLDLFTFN